MKVAIVLRKEQRGISLADEHDSERIAAYCRELGPTYGFEFTVIPPVRRDTLADRDSDAVLFVGADEFTRAYVERAPADRPLFLWAKGYDLTIDAKWTPALARIDGFFNSSYLTGREEPWNERTTYVPTAFHDAWPGTWSDRANDLRNRLVDTARFDVLFSGSDRHVRTDCYRQRLLNLLASRGMKICVAAPRNVWNRPHEREAVAEPLHPSIFLIGNWGTARTFRRARCVLDLPWLDNYFAQHPPHHDPNRSIFALGWNVFRAGAYGASMLTFDCRANRDLGLDESSCQFYQSDFTDLPALADEIAAIVNRGDDGAAGRRASIGQLFHGRHTYRARWQLMCERMADRLSGNVPSAGRDVRH